MGEAVKEIILPTNINEDEEENEGIETWLKEKLVQRNEEVILK